MTLPETQPTPATDPKVDPQGSYDVLVIGAGQAGLTLGYYLRQAGVRFLIVDAADQVGSAWAQRWDSLVLFTPRRYNAMPGLSFNGDPDQEPTRDEVIAYLHRYATEFDLPVQLNSAVTALHHADGRYVAELPTGTIHADHVVVATGPFQRPRIPDFASSVPSDVYQIHSSGYRRPSDLPPGRVVVVGGGNTGYQIAEELAADHAVVLAVGSRQPPLPRRLLGRQIFWWLDQASHAANHDRLASWQKASRTGDADRVEPGQGEAPRHHSQATRARRFRTRRSIRRRHQRRSRRDHLGDRLSVRLLLDPTAHRRRTGPPAAPSRSHRSARALLPRNAVATHPRIGPARTRQRGRPIHRPAHHR